MSEEGKKWIRIGREGRRGGERSGSVGSIDELWKRKREEMERGEDRKEEEEWAFRSGKKVQRSPQKVSMMELGKGEERIGWDGIKEDWKKEMRDVLREVKNELMEEMRGQGREIREELEKLKRQLKEKEEKWEKEKINMEGRIEEVERRMDEWKIGEERKIREGIGKEGEMEIRIREMERRVERKEREERRKNVIMKGIKGGKGIDEIEKEVEGLLRDVGIEVELEGIKVIGEGRKGETRPIVVKMRKMEQKRELMIRKRKVRERGIIIEDDLTWRERKMKWKLEEIARQERGKGKRVWVGYGKIQIEGKWWRWEEDEEILKDGEGKVWNTQGEGGGRRERETGK